MTEKTRVMLIATVFPFPKNVGKSFMLGGICDFLTDSSDLVEWQMLCFDQLDPKFILPTVVIRKPTLLAKLWNTLFYSLLLRQKSIQESFFWSRATSKSIEKHLEEFRPDVILYDTLRAGQYLGSAASLPATRIVYLDDLFSVRYSRLLEAIKQYRLEGVDTLGNFVKNIPLPFQSFYNKVKPLKTALLRMEMGLIQKSEDRAPRRFDRCLLISEAEANCLRTRTSASNIFSLPPRAAIEKKAPKRTWDGAPVFVFLGTLNLSHNQFAMEHFIEQVFSHVLEEMPDAKLRIIGKGIPSKLLTLVQSYPSHIEALGFVDDLEGALSDCCAMLSPLLFGSGVKIKVIDALYYGIPLISTAFGVEGIDTRNLRGVCLVSDLQKIPKAMLHFMDRKINEDGGRENRRRFEELYSRPKVDDVYRQLLVER